MKTKIFQGDSRFSRVDNFLMSAHFYLFRYRLVYFFLSVILYMAILIVFGSRLQIAGNYFIILPLVMAAVCFGFTGGLLAGILALSMNLGMFALLGHPEYAPANLVIAQLSGMLLGVLLGYFSDYFFKMHNEIQKRKETEESLRIALSDKEVLLQEIHHRVKNNLNIIKSLVQLQMNRTENEDFRKESEKLIQRIFSISLVHEQLFSRSYATSDIRLIEYLKDLIANISWSLEGRDVKIDYLFDENDNHLCMEEATPCGLIVNEVLTNCIKYAFPGVSSPKITIELKSGSGRHEITISDNGIGFDPGTADTNGLGLKLIAALVTQMGGTHEYLPKTGTGTVFRFSFPTAQLCTE